MQALDLIADSASHIQGQLTLGSLTSVELIKQCLQQIERNDRKGPNLRSIISLSAEAKLQERARYLDQERLEGRLLGPLHGIPIIVKVVWTQLELFGLSRQLMGTTHVGYLRYKSRSEDAHNSRILGSC